MLEQNDKGDQGDRRKQDSWRKSVWMEYEIMPDIKADLQINEQSTLRWDKSLMLNHDGIQTNL
jgi:hypothetical protein